MLLLKKLGRKLTYLSSRAVDLVFLLGPRSYAEGCGHRTVRRGKIRVGDTNVHVHMDFYTDTVDWCLRCLERMTIPCGRCGKPILIHRKIVLFSPQGEPLSKYAVRDPGTGLFIGCIRVKCASEEDYHGYWWMPGDDGHGYVTKAYLPDDAREHFAHGHPA